MVTPESSLGWRFGLIAVGGYLAGALLIAFIIWVTGSGEFAALFGLLILPVSILLILASSAIHDVLLHSVVVVFTLGLVAWYLIGWILGRVIMFYRDHS